MQCKLYISMRVWSVRPVDLTANESVDQKLDLLDIE